MSATTPDSNLGDYVSAAAGEVTTHRLNNTLASYAIGLLVTLIVLLIAALVAGEFAAAIPQDGEFSEGITQMIQNANTAFIIFGVAILVIPAVAAVVLIVNGFGGMVGGMGNGGNGGMGGGR